MEYTPKQIALRAAKALDDRKGLDIRLLEVADVTSIADYFLICTGTSNTHVKTLCDAVEAAVDELHEPLLHREGHRGGTWVLSCMYLQTRPASFMIWSASGTTRRKFPFLLRRKQSEI